MPHLDEGIISEIRAAQSKTKFEMEVGAGSDPDTLGQALVWLYDAVEYPFFQGEIYHQFHDDMVEKYPPEYNALVDTFVENGKLKPTGCYRDGDGTETQVTITDGKRSDTSDMDRVEVPFTLMGFRSHELAGISACAICFGLLYFGYNYYETAKTKQLDTTSKASDEKNLIA